MRGSQRPTHLFTSESVTEGHPDKVCDQIADAIVDAHLAHDPRARVACEVLAKNDRVILAGEVRSSARPDHHAIVRHTLASIGHPADIRIDDLLGQQAAEIATAVDGTSDQGAGDQGLMFGYATAETPELMPLPILLAHRLARRLADHRHAGHPAWLRPDGKTQVTVRYDGHVPIAVEKVLVSTQHAPDVDQQTIAAYVRDHLLPEALGHWHHDAIALQVNPSGSFVQGGPGADCGVTGRKIIVDTYGGAARHGGGAFSGKDPSKVDRSAAYFARYVARHIVRTGAAARAEVQVAYAIGDPKPFSLAVDTFGTGDAAAALDLAQTFDWRPQAIIERLGLARPIYRQTAAYGHMGRAGLPWEEEVSA
jgi:S-adenosylmethionine synthetase